MKSIVLGVKPHRAHRQLTDRQVKAAVAPPAELVDRNMAAFVIKSTF